ncbi:MAG: insulinase family protein [Dehalococcoidia bacterium]|nr:insulinase family protein [Dehalococcoidia bacterium]
MARHQKDILESGLRIVSQQLPNSESVSILISVQAGSRNEQKGQYGVAHFAEHMLFKGTGKRPSPLLVSSPIESTGGFLNASTGYESTNYWCKVPENHFRTGIEILQDMMQNSLLNEEEINSERRVIIEEIKTIEDYPDSKTALNLDKLMWPDSALGRDIAGSIQSVENINQETIRAFLDDFYLPTNTVISIAGNLDHDKSIQSIDQLFLTHPFPGSQLKISPIENVQNSVKLDLEKRAIEQIHIHLGYPGVSITHPDRYALDLLNVILGDGMSSRLFQEIRERLGLVYDIESGITHLQDVGDLRITLAVDKNRYIDAIKAILTEVENLKTGLEGSEVVRAKQILKGRMRLRMDDSQAVAAWNAHQDLFNKQIECESVIREHIDRNDIPKLQKAAFQYLDVSKLNIAIVGDIESKEPILNAIANL